MTRQLDAGGGSRPQHQMRSIRNIGCKVDLLEKLVKTDADVVCLSSVPNERCGGSEKLGPNSLILIDDLRLKPVPA
jgi:hypothetical protein